MSKKQDEYLKPIKRKDMLEQAEKCEEFKQIAKGLWPDEFEEEWEDITEKITWKLEKASQGERYFLRGYYTNAYDHLFCFSPEKGLINHSGYAFKVDSHADAFRILKRKEA